MKLHAGVKLASLGAFTRGATVSLLRGILFAVLALTCAVAKPAPIFTNGPVDLTYGSYLSNSADGWFIAAEFSLSPGETTIEGVRWWGTAGDPRYPDNFTLRVFADSGGLPSGSPLFLPILSMTASDTGVLTHGNGLPVLQYEAAVDLTTLSANTPYWLSIFSSNKNWGWSADNVRLPIAFLRSFAENAWLPSQQRQAFDVIGQVPEPRPSVLLAAGITLLIVVTRRLRAAGRVGWASHAGAAIPSM
ncbi:MAG: hypothetical protein U1E86_07680 [Burkholderiaceae bacterium]